MTLSETIRNVTIGMIITLDAYAALSRLHFRGTNWNWNRPRQPGELAASRVTKNRLASQSVSNSVSMLISGSLDGFPVDHAGWRVRDMPENKLKNSLLSRLIL
jgi:hypothetical protein